MSLKQQKLWDRTRWLLLYPFLSLMVVYAILIVIEKEISRSLYSVLAVIGLLVPTLTLAIGYQRIIAFPGIRGVFVSSFLSSLTWVVIALTISRSSDGATTLTAIESVISLAVLTALASLAWIMTSWLGRVLKRH